MNNEEIRDLIREFYDSPLSFLEIRDGETYLKMKKPSESELQAQTPAAASAAPVAPVFTTFPMQAPMQFAPMQAAQTAQVTQADPTQLASTQAIQFAQASSFTQSPAADSAANQSDTVQDTSNLLEISSPIVGVFYEAPSPDEKPYVQVGDHVEPDQILCLIEAMKMFNEVKSPCAGTVREIPVANGETVGFGDVLIRIEED